MAIIRWRPIRSLTPRINNVFDELFSDSLFSTFFSDTAVAPKVDLTENDKELSISVELPGINKKDIEINYKDGYVTVSGEKKDKNEEKDKDYYKTERRYGKFCRSFSIPEYVDTDKILAKYSNGILKIKLPKNEKAIPKEIPINIE